MWTDYVIECVELGCTAMSQPGSGYCVVHLAQFWPLWAAHPLDHACPAGCPSRDREIAEGFYCDELF